MRIQNMLVSFFLWPFGTFCLAEHRQQQQSQKATFLAFSVSRHSLTVNQDDTHDATLQLWSRRGGAEAVPATTSKERGPVSKALGFFFATPRGISIILFGALSVVFQDKPIWHRLFHSCGGILVLLTVWDLLTAGGEGGASAKKE